MAHGRSSGRIEWGGQTYEFEDAPSYAEKNWGAGFPRRWFWVQCNSFEEGDLRPEGTADISVTATGATRKLPGPLGEEDVALIGVHIRGAGEGGSTVVDVCRRISEMFAPQGACAGTCAA